MALFVGFLLEIGGTSLFYLLVNVRVLSIRSSIVCLVIGLLFCGISIGYIINNIGDFNYDKGQYTYKVKVSDHSYYTNEIKSDKCGYYIDDYYVHVFRILGKGDDLAHRNKVVFINRGDTVIDQSIDKDISVDFFCKD
jgi:hypothetical protein